MRFFTRLLLAVALAFAPVVASVGPSQALTPNQRVILSGAPFWTLPGASVDCSFSQYGCWVKGQGYVPVGSLLSTTRAQTVSSYATTSKGLLVPFAANTPRITDLGLLVEQGSTNTALHSRDMTQASWVAVNMTPALNAVGADGVANSATTLTATAGNATILQPLTIGSTTETYSVYLKRVSGTGTINISENGGSSWTACTINSSTFTRCQVEATLANPSVGIQIVTNGDVIVADFNQNEALAFATSPIPTTTTSVARAADNILASGQLLTSLQGSAWSLIGAVNKTTANTSAIAQVGITAANRTEHAIASNGSGAFTEVVSSSVTNNVAYGTTVLGAFKYGIALSNNTAPIIAKTGVLGTTSSSANPTVAGVSIGSRGAFSDEYMNGVIIRLTAFKTQLPAAQMQALTQ